MRKKIVLLLSVAVAIIIGATVAYGASYDDIMLRWSKNTKLVDKEDGVSNLEITATYYSAEFIDAYIQSQAQKNLWTKQEADDYKYNFLKSLRLQDTIPVQIKFINNASTMYLGPFDIMVKLRIGNQTYKPVDYDRRFNFKFQGEKEGLVYFRRYDEKTGKDLLKNVKSVTLELSPNINAEITRGNEVKFIWDVANDDPNKLFQGKAALRFENDRLLKRLDKLKKDEADLQKQLKSVEDEKGTIEKRLDELAKE